VTRRSEYLAIQTRGQRFASDHYLLFVLPREGGAGPRFGITVSRKVGNAVVRNQVKRWVRESCRRMVADFPPNRDLVIVARPSAAGCGLAPTGRELASLARRLRGK
jgi:ribonuclease P protein component